MTMELLYSAAFSLFMALASIGFLVPFAEAEGLCFMLYQSADNNLDWSIRGDNDELIHSALLQNDSSVTAWVYFDALNPNVTGYEQDFVPGPLLDLYHANGTAVTESYYGSQYLTYDHDMQKMIVDTQLGEINSDSKEAVYDFVSHALNDCVAKDKTEFFIAFSSHGAAYAGFGEDVDPGTRRLLQLNQNLNSALRSALADVQGAPEMFDVLGFDACLMSSYDALDDYRNITKYYLASEATIPGYGKF